MTDRDALRAALAEALRTVFANGSPARNSVADADAILAHPAVLAALAGSDPCAGCGNAIHYAADHGEEGCRRCTCSQFVGWPDRSDPAAGLREELRLQVDDWRERQKETTGRKEADEGYAVGIGHAIFVVEELLAAAPTASPTATGEREP